MPQTAAWIDEIKRVFGNDAIRRIKANERGNEIAWVSKQVRAEHTQAPEKYGKRRGGG
jgi:hypothetical protein